MMDFVWFSLFMLGSGIAIFAWLAPVYRMRSAYTPIQELAERWRRRSTEVGRLELPAVTPPEQAYLELARVAGITWPYRQYMLARILAASGGSTLMLINSMVLSDHSMTLSFLDVVKRLGVAGGIGALLWVLPAGIMNAIAMQRRAIYLAEISKFSHRLAICMTDKADIRELILRAGRPLRLLQPHIHKLAGQWGNDQRAAIIAFKDGVGISEAYPLVNAFTAISRAKASDIGRLLVEHSRSIDATLESELNRRIENAPVWISFYIMIPFFVCLLLFIYPWVLTVLEQMKVSFTVG
jgi:hypothetical protein